MTMGILVGAALLVSMASGCGAPDGPPLETLTATDVTGLPAGNALGSRFAGQYLTTEATITACRCRVGSCSVLRLYIGNTTQFVQKDGALTYTVSNGSTDSSTGAGGVDDDGKFWTGSVAQAPEVTVYSLVNGTFELAGGVPTSAACVSDATITGVIADTNLDCDLRSSVSLRYEGP